MSMNLRFIAQYHFLFSIQQMEEICVTFDIYIFAGQLCFPELP